MLVTEILMLIYKEAVRGYRLYAEKWGTRLDTELSTSLYILSIVVSKNYIAYTFFYL